MMRVFEMLLLLVVTLTLLSSFLTERKRTPRIRFSLPLLSLLLLVIHLILEKYRWQMFPVYGLVLLLMVINLVKLPKLAVRGLAVVGVVVLAVAVFILISFPVMQLPKPTGPYAVGTTYLQFDDSSRPETLTSDPDDTRHFSGRVWYPAEKPDSDEPMEYQDYQASINLISAGGPPEFIFSHFHLLTSNSYLDAPISDSQPSYPVLVFSIGFLTLCEDYQILAEALASHGYVVLILDTPYEWQGIEQEDGTIISYSKAHADAYHQHEDEIFPLWERFWDEDTSDAERNALSRQMLDADTFMDTILRIRVADIQFAIDELERLNSSLFAGKLDFSRLGILGHSMGGAVAGQTCLVDNRFKACANLDGFQWGDVADGKIHQPFMMLYSDQFEGANDFILPNLDNTAYVMTVRDSTHMNFQDAAVVIPGTKTIGLTGSISADRMVQITNDYLLAFFGKYLNGEEAPLLDNPSRDYPEVKRKS